MNCLLCSSDNLTIKETVTKSELTALWKRDVDVSNDIKTDLIHKYYCKKCSLSFFDPLNAGGNHFYSALGEYDWYYLHPGKTEYQFVQKLLKENDKVLDIGAGRGELFNKTKIKIDYTGLELSSKAVELAQQAGINVKNEDLLIYAQQHDSEYDIVTLFQVLEHLTEINDFLTSIKKVLKKGALFCIAVPNNNGFISYSSNYLYNLPPHHTILWKESSLRYMASKFDFDVIEVEFELLQDVHREHAYLAYLVYIFKKILFLKIKLIDNSKIHNFITEFCSILMRRKLFRIIVNPILLKKVKYGQSIIMTLRKR